MLYFKGQNFENRLFCVFQAIGKILLQRYRVNMTKSRQQSTKVKVKETDPTWNHVFSSLLQNYRWRINGTFCLRSRKKSGANGPKSNFTYSKKTKTKNFSAFTENQSWGFCCGLQWVFFSHCVVKNTWKRRAQVVGAHVVVFWSAWREKWKFCYCCSIAKLHSTLGNHID